MLYFFLKRGTDPFLRRSFFHRRSVAASLRMAIERSSALESRVISFSNVFLEVLKTTAEKILISVPTSNNQKLY